jgi:putative N-acetyltransferase (TIGR04045 family)
MLSDLPCLFMPAEYRIKQVTQAWEADAAYALRRAVFCAEQGIFSGDDRDEIDAHAHLLVALTCVGGTPDQVIGTVRIHADSHAAAPGVWWGSRLAVHPSFRTHSGLGSTLIRLAVGTARAQGCQAFFAHVQRQNAPLFERLHWRVLEDETLRGRAHCLMQAELERYAPCTDPQWGLALCAQPPRQAVPA